MVKNSTQRETSANLPIACKPPATCNLHATDGLAWFLHESGIHATDGLGRLQLMSLAGPGALAARMQRDRA